MPAVPAPLPADEGVSEQRLAVLVVLPHLPRRTAPTGGAASAAPQLTGALGRAHLHRRLEQGSDPERVDARLEEADAGTLRRGAPSPLATDIRVAQSRSSHPDTRPRVMNSVHDVDRGNAGSSWRRPGRRATDASANTTFDRRRCNLRSASIARGPAQPDVSWFAFHLAFRLRSATATQLKRAAFNASCG